MTATAAGTWRAKGTEDSESLVDKAGVCDLVIFCFALAFSSLVSLGLAPDRMPVGQTVQRPGTLRPRGQPEP